MSAVYKDLLKRAVSMMKNWLCQCYHAHQTRAYFRNWIGRVDGICLGMLADSCGECKQALMLDVLRQP